MSRPPGVFFEPCRECLDDPSCSIALVEEYRGDLYLIHCKKHLALVATVPIAMLAPGPACACRCSERSA